MARIAGVELPRNKRMEIALTYIYGIGRKSALDICQAAEIEPSRRTDDVTDEEVARLRREIDNNYKVEATCVAT
jgi:small subunit ribosomal protein S13